MTQLMTTIFRWNKMQRRRFFKAILPALLLLITTLYVIALPVQAHGYIVRSIPEDRATLERPPTRLQYWFSEALEPSFSSINLRDETGQIIMTGGVDDNDSSLLALQIPPGLLSDGSYIVELRPAFASDGHVVAESRVFFVGDAAANLEGSAASDLPLTLEIIWKALLDAGAYLLFGVFTVYAWVLIPAWGSNKYPIGNLPPRLMRRLEHIVAIGFALTISANILALIQQSMVFFNADAGRVISDGLWQVVRIGSRFGDMWNARMLFLIVAIGLLLLSRAYRDAAPALTRSMWRGNAWLIALIIGTQAINSHAAGSLILPWLGMIMHWLHTLGVAFWIGGVLVLVAVLPVALKPYDGAQRQAALQAVMRHFSRLLVAAVMIVVVSGIYNSSNWFLSPDTVASTYGVAMGAKLVMVALLLLMGALHHIALRPQLLERFSFLRRGVDWAGSFGSSMRIEALVAVVALASAAALSSTPTPQPDFLQNEVVTPQATQTIDDLTVMMTISPGGPGVNTVDIVLQREETPLNNAEVDVQVSSPSRAIRGDWQEADPLDAGLYVAASDIIDRAGEWWSVLNITLSNGESYRVAFSWQISADAAVIQSRPPTPLTWTAIVLVTLTLLVLLVPLMRDYAAKNMEFSAQNVLIGVGVTVISIVALIIGVVVMVQQMQQLEESRNPRPDYVNTQLPTQESLVRGQEQYEQHCIAWLSSSDFPVLLRQVESFRDDALYLITLEGWRNVPPCDEALTDDERWDVVNYLRTLQPKR